MDYAMTLEVVRLAEQFHEKFEKARHAARFDGIGAEHRQACEGLPAEAQALFRNLTTIQCLIGRPDLAEHFLDGNLSG